MLELRTDSLTGRSVLVAENRAARPNEFGDCVLAEPAAGPAAVADRRSPAHAPQVAACPFCPGHEHITPPAVFEMPGADGRWQIRVVPNKYPAVTECAAIAAAEATSPAYPPATRIVPAVGVHEVIIESPRHVDHMSSLSASELGDVLATYAQRLRHWRDDERLAYGLVFKNQGQRAGASLVHVHSQFIALPAIPPAVESELGRAERMFRWYRGCRYCQLIEQERSHGQRVVFDGDGLIAFCPIASMQPYEVWLLPTEHHASFDDTPPELLERLAVVLHALAVRVESVVADGALNVLVRTAPWRVQCGDWCHWRFELLPRVIAMAGFELAGGMSINPVAPERAASKLRSV
jgi:UDPglucose--hexose-1-phosphate uridylyltransferase